MIGLKCLSSRHWTRPGRSHASRSLAMRNLSLGILCWYCTNVIYGFVIESRVVAIRHVSSLRSSSNSNAYGKNSDIWPPTNENGVKIQDSFPNGRVPEQLARSSTKKRWIRIPRILQRAAKAQEEELFVDHRADKTTVLLALVMLRWVRPLDLIIIFSFSGYLAILSYWASSLNSKGRPHLPALPPQGHVPALVDNPLGSCFHYSRIYDRWLQAGVILGLVGPILWMIIQAKAGSALPSLVGGAVGHVARPVLLLCVQIMTEFVARRWAWPLPLRILVPVFYNTCRLGYYYQWAIHSHMKSVLAVANLLYWSTNLFGFLLPIAVMRYLRAHFMCVEAEQVVLRDKDSIGLLF